MKTLFYTKTLIALAVAVAAAAAAVSQAQEQPIPPPMTSSALPANIVPGTPLAEVVKMVQAGVDVGTLRSYILNSQGAFNLDADKIIFLKDEGVPSDLINTMMERDKILYASTLTPAPAAAPVVTSVADTAPPPAQVTVNYFYDTLTPYGSWVDLEGYGRCWRPTVMIYDSTWRPYCDRGHWVYTDCGWYWDSDYSWGATFHYGRWFQNPRFGWCWYPDTEWAPSWVTWRSGGAYCGWAPLPPLAVFRPGFGFFYRGVSVGLDFDFGLGAGYFTFVSPEHFCDRHPRSYFAEPTRVTQIFQQTTVINNFNVNRTTIVNRGISVDHISSVTHHPIEPVHVNSLPNAGRHGWRGEGFEGSAQHGSADNNTGRNFSGGISQLRHGPELRNDVNNNANAGHRESLGQTTQAPKLGGNQNEPLHPTTQPNLKGQGNNNRESLGQTTQAPKLGGNQIEPFHSTTQPNLKGQANNNNQTVYQLQHQNEPVVMGNNRFQQSQPSSAKAGAVVADRRQTQYNWQSGGGDHGQSQNNSPKQQFVQPQQSSSFATPAPSASQQHPAWQLEQHPIATPSQPRVEQHQFVTPVQPKAELRVESATRSYSPPPPPAPASVQSQPHNTSSGSDHGSTSSNKDKQNR